MHKTQPRACDGASYKTTGGRLRHWRLTHIQYAGRWSHKSAADLVNSRKHTSSCHATSNYAFFHRCLYFKQARSSPEDCHTLLCLVSFSRRSPLLKRQREHVLRPEQTPRHKYQHSQVLFGSSQGPRAARTNGHPRVPVLKEASFRLRGPHFTTLLPLQSQTSPLTRNPRRAAFLAQGNPLYVQYHVVLVASRYDMELNGLERGI